MTIGFFVILLFDNLLYLIFYFSFFIAFHKVTLFYLFIFITHVLSLSLIFCSLDGRREVTIMRMTNDDDDKHIKFCFDTK